MTMEVSTNDSGSAGTLKPLPENGMGTERVAPQASGQAKNFTWDFSKLAACVLPHLDSSRAGSCQLVRWIKRRREKFVVEIETPDPQGKGNPPLRYIVKMDRRGGTRDSYEALSRLWEAGFRPPSPYTVPRPVAYIADQGLLVQEKAPGERLLDILRRGGRGGDDATDAMGRAAGWLASLHTSAVEAPLRRPLTDFTQAALVGSLGELAEIFPSQASRITRLAARALEQLQSTDQSPSVPSHGDFHPKNIFISEAGQVTVIDFDTFGRQEAAADVAYLLTQTAIMGYFHCGSFSATSKARDCFLAAYENAVSSVPRSRLALYAFLQSLHYELCGGYLNDKADCIEPWLEISERCILGGELTMS